MADTREYDFVVFGATGFTGRHVVTEALRYQTKNDKYKWAIAGRSLEKLKETLKTITQEETDLTNTNTDGIGLIEANTENEESIETMAAQTKLVFNVVGPYRHLGEPVVKACVSNSTNYIDICGEPEFLERMELKYNDEAKEKDLAIVQSCGFDSVPADFGTLFLQRQYTSPACLTSVETFLSVKAGPQGSRLNYATYEAAVQGFGAQDDLRKIRKQASELKKTAPRPRKKPLLKRGPFEDPRMKDCTCYMFPGADASVIRRSQDRLSEGDPDRMSFHVSCYVTTPKSLMNTTKMVWYGTMFNSFAKYNMGRNLLLKYPETFSNGYFSRTTPTKSQLQDASFQLMCYGKGYNESPSDLTENENPRVEDKLTTVRVSGPELGYIATSRIMLQMGLLILEKNKSMPSGVMTPGFAFSAADVFDDAIERLRNNQIEFQVVQEL